MAPPLASGTILKNGIAERIALGRHCPFASITHLLIGSYCAFICNVAINIMANKIEIDRFIVYLKYGAKIVL